VQIEAAKRWRRYRAGLGWSMFVREH
jgi:hypothetical protein